MDCEAVAIVAVACASVRAAAALRPQTRLVDLRCWQRQWMLRLQLQYSARRGRVGLICSGNGNDRSSRRRIHRFLCSRQLDRAAVSSASFTFGANANTFSPCRAAHLCGTANEGQDLPAKCDSGARSAGEAKTGQRSGGSGGEPTRQRTFNADATRVDLACRCCWRGGRLRRTSDASGGVLVE